eukprot:gb/GEZN01006879.1/.p1 GENE.gb/GEZN01006879.1/~~gb/GEZN01006879.1/.p1  ORF type:complete len:485 (+),score=45.40 gb/GEZN01006879.1/:42-1496(+)
MATMTRFAVRGLVVGQRSMTTSHPVSGSFRVGIVGAGPAGFYTAKYLLRDIEGVSIDMFDRLPTPYGLVRSGVAPDHQDVKSVTKDFAKVAGSPGVRFFGNVTIGKDVRVDQLLKCYHAVVMSYGAEGERSLNIPGEYLKGVDSARTFVNWYNGHPDFQKQDFNFDSPHCVIIGQGNVAVDCARVLLESLEYLNGTDITSQALQRLRSSKVECVTMVGRRGPVQAAFAIKELRELTKLDGVKTQVLRSDLESISSVCRDAIVSNRSVARKFKLIEELQTEDIESPVGKGPKRIAIRFFLSPKEFLPDPARPDHLGAVLFEKTAMEGAVAEALRAIPTGQLVTIRTNWVLKSVGFKSHPMPGLPFDDRLAVIPTDKGRVRAGSQVLTGVYASGWVKRGPIGIIGSNIGDAKETVAAITEDRQKLLAQKPDLQDMEALLDVTQLRVVRDEGWARINVAELARGHAQQKAREKFVTIEDLLKTAESR